MNVYTAIPTRGLVHAKTVESVLANTTDIHFVIGKPMPDCFNSIVQAGLEAEADYIWFVEEDNECPKGVLEALLSLDADIATLPYTVGGNHSHIYKRDNEILWCGLGCTLIKTDVFRALPAPWFEVNKHLNFDGDGFKVLELPPERVPGAWGGHDSYFFYCRTRPLGFKIKELTGWHGAHYRVKELPKLETNVGMYTITEL